MLETLREDFSRLPELLALGAPEQPPPIETPSPVVAPAAAEASRPDPGGQRPPSSGEGPPADQLGLF